MEGAADRSSLTQKSDVHPPPEEIGVFVRSADELSRARKAVKEAGQTPLELSDRVEDRAGRIAIGTMHLAKGLEFRQVIVMACDENVLPDQDRMDTVADEVELDEVYDTERQLFYVACTRARESLIVSGVSPASEFFADLKDGENARSYTITQKYWAVYIVMRKGRRSSKAGLQELQFPRSHPFGRRKRRSRRFHVSHTPCTSRCTHLLLQMVQTPCR